MDHFCQTPTKTSLLVMPPRSNVQKPSNENQIQLALQAIKQDASLTQRRAAVIYNVSRSTLERRIAGKLSRRDYRPANVKRTATKEAIVPQRALGIDERGFSL
jgi:hypothetical protein